MVRENSTGSKAPRRKKVRTALLAVALMLPATGLVIYAPTLYVLFCQATGLGGTVQQASGVTRSTRAAAPADARPAETRKVTVRFDAEVGPGLDWEFRPEQRTVTLAPGEPAKIYYYARNRTDRTVVARATFNVTPFKAAPYFFKIECFCFTEERLGPGQSARMPVVLYVDEEMFKNPDTREIQQITLFYTFYEVRGDAADPKAARDLKAGSKRLDGELERTGKARFLNDAQRR